MNLGVSVKNQMVGVLVKMIICTGDCECNNPCKIDKYLDIKNCSCKKRLFGRLGLTCEDEIYTTETSLDDKKLKRKKIPVFSRFYW